jgi:O-antigen ligase
MTVPRQNVVAALNGGAGRLAGLLIALIVPTALFSSKAMAPWFILISALLLAQSYPWRRFRFDGIAAAMLAFGLFSALSVSWSPGPLESLQTLVPFLITLVVGYVVIKNVSGLAPTALNVLHMAILAGGIVGYSIIAIEYVSDYSLQSFLYSLLGKTLLPSSKLNAMKPGLVVASLYLWPWSLVAWRRFGGKIAGVAFVFGSATILLHQFDTAIVALMASIVLALSAAFLVRRHMRVIAVGFAIIVLAAPLIAAKLPDPTQPGSGLAKLSNSAIHRIAIWTVSDRLIRERPVLGHGFESARMQFRSGSAIEQVVLPDVPDRQFTIRSEPIPLHPHNFILQVWLETGVIGASCLAAFLAYVTRHASDATGGIRDRLITFGLIGSAFCIANISFGAWQSWWLGTLFLAALLMRIALEPVAPD